MYDLEGAWIDGECWACFPDYSEYAQKAFEQETGARPTEETKGEYLHFLRRGFFDYVNHYVEELQAYRPNFDITSNWLKSSFSPDMENRGRVPYLSGDVAGTHCWVTYYIVKSRLHQLNHHTNDMSRCTELSVCT